MCKKCFFMQARELWLTRELWACWLLMLTHSVLATLSLLSRNVLGTVSSGFGQLHLSLVLVLEIATKLLPDISVRCVWCRSRALGPHACWAPGPPQGLNFAPYVVFSQELSSFKNKTAVRPLGVLLFAEFTNIHSY